MMSIVVKRFRGPQGVELEPGDGPLDTATWRTERQLHSQHYLRPATPEEVALGQGVVHPGTGRKRLKLRA